VLNDVGLALKSVANIGSVSLGSYKTLQSKQELVLTLLENERARLKVWLLPLEQERKHYISNFGNRNQPEVSDAPKTVKFDVSDLLALGNCIIAQNRMGGKCELGHPNSSSVPIRKDPKRRALVAPQLPREGPG
jgi:hypothetical protein